MPAHIILVRHAHAEWPNYVGRDFDRPLTPRGEQEARSSARAIALANTVPDLILASPARRTRQTAEILAQEFQLDSDSLRCVDALYNASASTLTAVLQRAASEAGVLALVAHNPGISDLARSLSRESTRAAFAPGEWCDLPLRVEAGRA
jgi:phosphohistidine phosphatase